MDNREKIELTHDELMELWNQLYYIGNQYILKGVKYLCIDIINTSHKSDGDSWDYIIQREVDGKFFKFHVWDAGSHNGYIFEDKYIEEVFQKISTTYNYE